MVRKKAPGVGTQAQTALFIAIGFAAFKVVQTYLYSTAVFHIDATFIVVSGMGFSMASAAVVMLTDLAVVMLVFSGRLRPPSMPVLVPAAVLCATTALSFFKMLGFADPLVQLVVVSVAYGVASVMITLAWVGSFSRLNPDSSMKSLAFAMLLASVASFILQAQEPPVAFGAIVLLLAASAWLHRMVASRQETENPGASRNPTMLEQEFGSGPKATGKRVRPSVRKHLQSLIAIGEGLASLLVLGCVVGILNGFMIAENFLFDGSPLASHLGSVIAAMAFFVLAFTFPRAFSATKAYRILFPVLTGLLILWPSLDFNYSYFFSIAFLAGYGFISTSVMYLIIHETHRKELNPYAFMGASMFLIRLFSALGILIGASVSSLNEESSFKTMLVVAIGLYLLSMVLLFMLRGRKDHAPSSTSDDSFDRTAAQLAREKSLTERETDILKLIARGRTAAYIGQELYLSPHTVRCHMKSIYAKIGIHSKQELIDLFYK